MSRLKVTIENGPTYECEIKIGQTILDVAEKDESFYLEHECCGCARCSTCRVRILKGEEVLSIMEEEEQDMLDKAGLEDPYRLGCQTRLEQEGDIELVVPKEYARAEKPH